MRCFWPVPLVLGLALCVTLPQAQADLQWLTVQEHVWISQHPVVRVAVREDFYPLENVEKGKFQGLSAEYLDEISQQLGIRFQFVPVPNSIAASAMLRLGAVDLVSMIWRMGPEVKIPGIALTTPYRMSPTIVIARTNSPLVFELSQFEGKSVVVPAYGAFDSLLRDSVKNVEIIASRSAEEALTRVAEGNADFTLGSETYLMPYFTDPKYEGRLQLSGVIAPMVSATSMGVREDQTLLLSILQKSLAGMSVAQYRDLNGQWLKATNYGAHSVSRSIIEDYVHEVTLAGVTLLVMLGLVHQTYWQRRQAVRSERDKAKFLAVMSHEIRSPMNAVLAAVELLSLSKLDHEQRHLSTLATSGANTLLRLLDDVLDLSRLEAHQLQLELDVVDIAALAAETVALYSLRAQTQGIRLTLDIQASPECLLLDEARVAQVLHNLISNAIKFTEQGSVQVTVVVGDTHEDDLKQLDILVTDTGIGIPSDTQRKLFEPYSQAHNSYKRSGGSGLGLVICRELIELMGGVISLTSEVGKGTMVIVSFCAESANTQVPTQSASRQPDLSLLPEKLLPVPDSAVKVNILLVEDTPANQQALLAQMRSFGLEAVLAPDAAHAQLRFAEHCFDLVLMDCDLPDSTGYAVVIQMRAQEISLGRTRCPILAISASTGHEHADRCFAAGMDGMLSKPIQLAKLKTAIELWCDVSLVQKAPVAENQVEFGPAQVREAVLDDLLCLFEATALDNPGPALHRAHRLHGAALSLGWVEFALTAQRLESLLRSEVTLDDQIYRTHLKGLMRQWRHLDQQRMATDNE